VRDIKTIINVNSKELPSGKTRSLQSIPKRANLGTVERNANTEDSQPLYTSTIQFAKGNIASLEIKPRIIIIQENEYSRVLSLVITISYISLKFKLEVSPYKYDTPNNRTPVAIAFVIKYLKLASLEEYPFSLAIKKYVGKLKSSKDTNSVKKSFALTIFIAPNIPVNRSA